MSTVVERCRYVSNCCQQQKLIQTICFALRTEHPANKQGQIARYGSGACTEYPVVQPVYSGTVYTNITELFAVNNIQYPWRYGAK